MFICLYSKHFCGNNYFVSLKLLIRFYVLGLNTGRDIISPVFCPPKKDINIIFFVLLMIYYLILLYPCYISPHNVAVNAFCKWSQIVCIYIISLSCTKQYCSICVCFAICVLNTFTFTSVIYSFVTYMPFVYYTKSAWCWIWYVLLNAQNLL